MTEKSKSKQSSLRTTALTTLLVGTIGSLYFMFIAGSNQKSIILFGLFTTWVISPFVGLFLATQLTKHWTEKTHSWFYSAMFVLTFVSLTVYSGVLTTSHTKPAFNFLVVPLLSWLVILTILFFAKKQNMKK
jgi:hypothetical protein